MSIVAVHGPHTFGSKAVVDQGPAVTTVDPTNGLKWDFKLDFPTTRPDQDFSWAFPTDGTPTPQVLADPTVVTYATPGSKTATLTVTNVQRTINNKALTANVATLTTSATHGFKVGQTVVVAGVDATFNGTFVVKATPTGTTFTYDLVAANVTSAAATGTATSADTQYPPAGSYPITVTAVSGVAPLMAGQQSADDETEPGPTNGYDGEAYSNFILADHSVAEIKDFLGHYELTEENVNDLISEEEEGANRTTLLDWFNTLRA